MESRINIEKANKMALLELLKIREEIDRFMETLDILEDEETLKSIRKGMKDIEEGVFISLEELIEKYGLQNEI
jgi:molecular chaperone GrpE (heat shock protein)